MNSSMAEKTQSGRWKGTAALYIYLFAYHGGVSLTIVQPLHVVLNMKPLGQSFALTAPWLFFYKWIHSKNGVIVQLEPQKLVVPYTGTVKSVELTESIQYLNKEQNNVCNSLDGIMKYVNTSCKKLFSPTNWSPNNYPLGYPVFGHTMTLFLSYGLYS